MRGLSLVAASGGRSSSRCAGLSLSRPLLMRGTGSRRAGSVAVAHGPSCSVACGIFPDQDSNPCSLHWQADSQPLRHQGSPGSALESLGWLPCFGEWARDCSFSRVNQKAQLWSSRSAACTWSLRCLIPSFQGRHQ